MQCKGANPQTQTPRLYIFIPVPVTLFFFYAHHHPLHSLRSLLELANCITRQELPLGHCITARFDKTRQKKNEGSFLAHGLAYKQRTYQVDISTGMRSVVGYTPLHPRNSRICILLLCILPSAPCLNDLCKQTPRGPLDPLPHLPKEATHVCQQGQ